MRRHWARHWAQWRVWRQWVRRHWAVYWVVQLQPLQEPSWSRHPRLLCPLSVWHRSCRPAAQLHLVRLQRRREEPSQQALLSLGRQQEPQTLASSSAAWLGELLIERLPWVAGDMLAEVQVIGHSVTRQRRSAGSPQLDQQTFWPLHGHHHWRSSGPLSRDGPEAEPQARPERAARHWSDPRAELLRIVT